MSNTEVLWREVEQEAERLLSFVRDLAPKSEIELPTAHAYILGFFWRCVRLFDGALLLIKAELPEEASFLARSLFEDSLRLLQLASEPEMRIALILGWINTSIKEKRGLLQVAKALGIDGDIGAELVSLEHQRRRLEAYGSSQGVAGLRRFRSVKDAAIKFNRKDEFWTYEWAHEAVHGTDAVWMFARRETAPDVARFHAKTNDAVVRSAITDFAARSVTDAAIATSDMFGWPASAGLNQPSARIRQLLSEKAR